MTELPTFVSVIEDDDPDVSTKNLIRITYNLLSADKYKFSACVQPMFNFNDTLRLVEWIEFHKIMGVEKFTFYNISMGAEISCLLESYGDIVDVLPWSTPYTDDGDFGAYGQTMAYQHCRSRYKGISEFLIFVDVDEMIVPRQGAGNSYSEMMESINACMLT